MNIPLPAPMRLALRPPTRTLPVPLRNLLPILLPFLITMPFSACDWQRRSDLPAETGGAPEGPACASCHAYPPPDANHMLHLGHEMADLGNGAITCRDCHAASIPGRPTLVLDSIFLEIDGIGRQVEWSGLAFPDADFMRAWPLARVDTLRQIRPIPQAGAPAGPALLREWVTGAAHLNGRLDVAIDSLDSDPERFEGRRAEYHPERLSCTAVRCHSGRNEYQWPGPANGMTARGRYGP